MVPYQHPSYADGKRPNMPSRVDKPNSGTDTGKGTASPTQPTSKHLSDTGGNYYLAKYFDKAKGPFCFGCKDWEHIAAHCPKKTVFACEPVCNHSDDYPIKANLMESIPSSSSTQLHRIHSFLALLSPRKY